MSADRIRLPEGFASSGDPFPSNPFSPENPRHQVWNEATRVAELEFCQVVERSLTVPSLASVAAFLENPLDPVDWLVSPTVDKFDIWARRGIQVVWSDVEVRQFDDWLLSSANHWLEVLANFLVENPPPFSTAPLLTEARVRLGARVKYWQGQARRYRAEQGAAGMAEDSGAEMTSVDAKLKERRRSAVAAYREANGLTAPGLARRVGISETAVRGIVNEDTSRFSAATQGKLLETLNLTRSEWYRM